MTDLNALAERLERYLAGFAKARGNDPDIIHMIDPHSDNEAVLTVTDLRQAAQALRVVRRIGMMTVYHEDGNAMTLGDAPAIARSALKGRDGLE